MTPAEDSPISQKKPNETTNLSIDDVHKLSRLIRIAITDEEAKELHGDLSGVLNFVSQMEEVDVSGLEPLFSPLDGDLENRAETPMMEDHVRPGLARAALEKNAPSFQLDHFVVPRVIEE